MSSTDIFPRKWSIRYSCDSSMSACRLAFSSRADARSCPNGFSIDDAGVPREARVREPADDRREQRGRDLEVEDRQLLALDLGGDLP